MGWRYHGGITERWWCGGVDFEKFLEVGRFGGWEVGIFGGSEVQKFGFSEVRIFGFLETP